MCWLTNFSNGDCIDRNGVRILNTAVSGDGQEHL